MITTSKTSKTIKNFIIGNMESMIWLFIYSIIEIAIAFSLFVIYLKFSYQFRVDFLDIFSFIEKSNSMSDIEFSISMLNAMMKLTDKIVLPVIGVSGIILIGILVIKCKITGTKVIRKLASKEINRYMLIGMSLNLGITFIINLIPEEFMGVYNSSVNVAIAGNAFLTVIVAGIIAPITEEIVFRKFIFDGCKRVSVKYAIIISAITFGVAHGNLIQGVYAFLFGLIFAYENNKKAEYNLLPSIIMHITINLSSIVASRIFSNEIIGLIVFFLVALLFFISNKIKHEQSYLIKHKKWKEKTL